jgi:spore photoproduct lyase
MYQQMKKNIIFTKRKNNFVVPYSYGKGNIGFKEFVIRAQTGCIGGCRYCYLQYFKDKNIIIFNNYDKLFKEIKDLIKKNGKTYFNAGENFDSLFLEEKSKFAQTLIPYIAKENAVLELRTKSKNVHSILNLVHNKKTVVSFSFSNFSLKNNNIEKDVHTLGDRILAMKKLQNADYLIGLRFEPLFLTENFKKEMKILFEKIIPNIKRKNLHSISLSLFRYTSLQEKDARKFSFWKELYKGEFIQGSDKKYRYFKFLRIEFYKIVLNFLKKFSLKVPVYLSCETPSVWRTTFNKNFSFKFNLCNLDNFLL